MVASALTSVVPPSSWITPSPAPAACAAVAPADRELSAVDLEAGRRRARGTADPPGRAARPGRVDVALDPAAVVQRQRPGDGEGAVSGDIQVGAVDRQSRALDRGLRAGVGRHDEHCVLRAADGSAACREAVGVELGLVAERERSAQRQLAGVLGVVGGDRHGLARRDENGVGIAGDDAAAPGRGRRPRAARRGRAARGRCARCGEQEQRE